MDTDSVIAQLMQLEAQPGARWAQQKKVSEARESALKDILTRVKNLQSESKNLKSVTTWADTQTVESSDSTKITAARVGGAAPGAYSISVQNLASGDQWSFKYNQPTADTSFTINMPGGVSQQVDLKAGQSIDETVGQINSTTDSKVYAVNVGGRLVLSSRDTGDAAAFTVTPLSASDALDQATQLRFADDAHYLLDGDPTPKSSASNVVKDGIVGVEFTLKQLVPAGSPVTLNVSNPAPDQSAVKDRIKKFVEQYNSTIDLIRSELTEEKVKDPKDRRGPGQGRAVQRLDAERVAVRGLRSSIGSAFDTGDANSRPAVGDRHSTGAPPARPPARTRWPASS